MMAKIYFEKLEQLLTELDYGPRIVEVKHFFSGAAGYVEGQICLSWTPAGLALKLSRAKLDQLFAEKQGTPLRYFPKAPIKREYALLAPELVADRVRLQTLIRECTEFVRSQPD